MGITCRAPELNHELVATSWTSIYDEHEVGARSGWRKIQPSAVVPAATLFVGSLLYSLEDRLCGGRLDTLPGVCRNAMGTT